jgi:hypothetical protein
MNNNQGFVVATIRWTTRESKNIGAEVYYVGCRHPANFNRYVRRT